VEAVRALVRATRLLERASGELSLAHYRVLSAIASGDERASRIAERLAIGKPTISAAVEWLDRRGLIERRGVIGDQRAVALGLTPAGRDLLTRVEADMTARLDDLCRRSGDGPGLLDALVHLGPAVDAVLAERRSGIEAPGATPTPHRIETETDRAEAAPR
jgi:DNA-binding MarR family transcriptional regulator